MEVMAATVEDWGWICAKTGCRLTPNARAIKAVDARGAIRGMVAYDDFTENAVQAHMATDSPIVWRSLLGPAFFYPFKQLGLGLILAVIPASNAPSVQLALRFGFREVHRVRDGWAKGTDLQMLEMRREDCRWIEA